MFINVGKNDLKEVMPYEVLHKIQVTSYGGVGTTNLCKHLSSLGCHLPQGKDWSVPKHQAHPPRLEVIPCGFRAIYLFGDPRNSLISLFRRGLQVRHFRRIYCREPDGIALEALSSLDAYVSLGQDVYGLAEHLDNWRSHAEFPVLFVRQDVLSTSWQRIAGFLSLPNDAAVLPTQIRTSDWRLQPRHIQEGLTTIHANLIDIVKSLPAVFADNDV